MIEHDGDPLRSSKKKVSYLLKIILNFRGEEEEKGRIEK